MRVKSIISAMIISIITGMACTAFASDNPCIFLAPQDLNEANEIIIPVYMENVLSDNLCGIEFKITYNTEQFTLKTDENSRPVVNLNSSMLMSDADAIDISADGDVISVRCISLDGDTILQNGPLFGFTLIPKSPETLWNSDKYYPLRFLPGSVNFIEWNKKDMSLTGSTAEGIDTCVGGYNVFPTLELPEVDGTMEFRIGSSSVWINGEEKQMDMKIYERNGETMLPLRFLAEALGMEVGYDDATATAVVYYPYMSAYVTLTDGLIYINARQRNDLIKAECTDNRTFVGVSVIEEMLEGAVEVEKDEAGVKLNFNKN